MNEVSIERLHELFTLTHDGRLIRNIATGSAKAGDVAGGFDNKGYRRVRIGKSFQSHRVVFAMVHGRWPTDQIDHANGIKDDNRPCNLREATGSQNQMNVPTRSNNKLGVKGVSFRDDRRKFVAKIRIAGKNKHLGLFPTAEAASAAYQSAAAKHHGEFASSASVPRSG